MMYMSWYLNFNTKIKRCQKNIKEFFENEVVRMILLIFEEYQRTLAFQKNTSYP